MRDSRKKLLVLAGFVAATAALTAANSSEPVDGREISRLRTHFAIVLGELRAVDVSRLTPSQLSARSVLITRLEEYAAAGRFPHNHVVDRFVPVFRDEHQTLCAMGYLIASTGRTDIVDDVARTNNLAFLPELAGDSRLQAWLDSTGFTVAEAARIQPMYGPGGCCSFPPPPPQPTKAPERTTSDAYFVGSGAAMVINAWSLMVNAAPRDISARKVRHNATVGIVTGASQFVLGVFAVDAHDAGKPIGIANMTVGAAGLTAAIWRARHVPEPKIAARTVSLQPIVGAKSAGLLVSARM
jgi:hypothetical protein